MSTLGGHWLHTTVADAYYSVHGVSLEPDQVLTIAQIADTFERFARGVADYRAAERAADEATIAELAKL